MTSSLLSQLPDFALHTVATAGGQISYRSAGPQQGPLWVLLHGIGSSSASWLAQLQFARANGLRVLAWDAPGYAQSSPVQPDQPLASDYALRVWQWLDALHATEAVTLVGHSLGSLMASAAVAQQAQRVRQLWLLSPAVGYGQATPALRAQKLNDRLHNLNTLGPAGMAAKRASAMLSASATDDQIAYVQHTMAQVLVPGYTQASQMLCGDDLRGYLQPLKVPADVVCGQADSITPAEGCAELAATLQLPFHSLGPVGHACPLEAPAMVNQLIFSTSPRP